MQIPHELLTPAALRKIVQEFVTRDGTDLSEAERSIEQVLRQLAAGKVELHYDEETASCNLLPRRNAPRPHTDSES